MLREAMEFLFSKGEDAKQLRLVRKDRHTQYAVMPDGEIKEVVDDLPARKHIANTLDSFVELLRKLGVCCVWVDFGGVLGVEDAEYREDSVYLDLHASAAYVAIYGMTHEGGLALGQAAMLKLLGRVLGVDEAVLAPFRRIEWNRTGTGSGSVEHGRESLGKHIEERVQGRDQLPEFLLVEIPLWNNLDLQGIRFPVKIWIDPRFDDQKFTLMVVPDAVAHLRHKAVDILQSRLIDAIEDQSMDIPVVIGSPEVT